ncbi:MAG: MurR/RpiR family transcriptional regulator [Clostridia bacterium]|nr:MurR/RpiR family transcriptional regulator [Clostridia bacterium]
MLECRDRKHPLTPAEKHVVDYLNDHIADIASLSITDISEGAFVSNATVSRAIRKCGFSSFIAARFHLAQEHAATANQIQANRVLAECYEECVRTIELINVNDILIAAQHIIQASRVIVLTRSISRGVAEYFCVQLVSLKCNALVICDSEIMERMDEFLKPDDMVIVLTLYNTTQDLCEAVKLARKVGCFVVTCCCRSGTRIQKLSDVTLLGYSASMPGVRKAGFSSRIPLMLITRCIAQYIAAIKEPGTGQVIPDNAIS